jgi:two-component system CheB/CheR fusion protein
VSRGDRIDHLVAELGSTSAELVRVNEELNSTNVELEAMSDALGLTSMELEDLNDTLRRRSEQLDDTTAFLGELLVGLRAAVVVCDREERIAVWNGGAERFWGVPARVAVGRVFGDLNLGPTVAPLVSALRGCLDGGRTGRRHLELALADAHGALRRCDAVLAPRLARREVALAVVCRAED